MAITPSTKDFIENLINYYVSEAPSYREIAEIYTAEVKNIPDTTFGIILGCVYSGFLQTYTNQKQTPALEDIQEFNQIIKQRASEIKKAILDKS
ncbi:MAG TPA: hypothetical protein VLB45_03275 [Nitrosopumilaceae archaeon]|nr:hypothetical protein [Nitrosopumilaceae archaeon]